MTTTKAIGRMKEAWTIGERKFKDNFNLRMQMFDSLVLPGAIYGCEVFGREIFDELEILQRRYIKWTLGLRPATRTNLIMYETKRTPIYLTTTTRARNFEKKALAGTNKLLTACVEWSRKYRQVTETPVEEMTKAFWTDTLTNCTDAYKKIATDGLPRYLTNCRHIQTIAKARCEDEERGRRTWGNKLCRCCGVEVETIEHLTKQCIPDERSREDILSETGDGIDFICKLAMTK